MNKSVQIGPLQIGIIALTVITAFIHLVILGFRYGDFLFILNGLGYLALLAALYLPLDFLAGYRHLARWALIGYTTITIILYFVFNRETGYDVFGLITKAIEVALIALLWVESRQQASVSAAPK